MGEVWNRYPQCSSSTTMNLSCARSIDCCAPKASRLVPGPRQTTFLAEHDASAPGCLVTDLIMPEMSGLELQRHLLAQGCVRPIVFITGRGDMSTAVEGMRAGAVSFLPKPVLARRAGRGSARSPVQGRHCPRPERGAATRTRPAGLADAARAPGARARGARPVEQADRRCARHGGEDHQGSSRPAHAQDAGQVGGGTGAVAEPRRVAAIVSHKVPARADRDVRLKRRSAFSGSPPGRSSRTINKAHRFDRLRHCSETPPTLAFGLPMKRRLPMRIRLTNYFRLSCVALALALTACGTSEPEPTPAPVATGGQQHARAQHASSTAR